MKTLRLAAILPVLLVSCASHTKKEKSAASEAPVRKKLSERVAEDNGYMKDANGNWVPRNNRRSEFESKGQDPNFAGKGVAKKEYKAGDYAKKSFWGNKEYDRKAYAGNTDGSKFQQPSMWQEKGAREAGSAAKIPDPYQTASYGTNAAREAGTSPLAKPGNAEIENRQKVYEQPRRDLTVDQTKGILGH